MLFSENLFYIANRIFLVKRADLSKEGTNIYWNSYTVIIKVSRMHQRLKEVSSLSLWWKKFLVFIDSSLRWLDDLKESAERILSIIKSLIHVSKYELRNFQLATLHNLYLWKERHETLIISPVYVHAINIC